jgi:O-antigen/teichoic acid export membrane protein
MNSKRTYIFTYLTEFSLLIAGLLVYRFAFNVFNDADFASYSLIRRNLSFFVPVIFLGLAVGITRFVSFNLNDKIRSGNFFIAGALLVSLSIILFSLGLYIFKKQIALIIFGDTNFSYLILPLIVLILGICIHSLSYAYFRGMMMMHKANLLQFINLCLGNLAAFLISKNLTDVIFFTGFIWIITGIFFLAIILLKIDFQWKGIISSVKEIFPYSIYRVPGDISLAAMLTIPSLITAHKGGLISAGYLAFGITLMNMAGAAFSPISLLLLPKISKLAADKQYQTIFTQTRTIIVATLLLSVFAIVVFEIFASQIINIYLNNASVDLISTARIIGLGVPGYTLYIVLRSVLDALHYKAINSRNVLISFGFYSVCVIILLLIGFNETINILLFTFSISLLGLLTYFDLLKSKRSFLG